MANKIRNSKKALKIGGLFLGLALITGISASYIKASDHDDGVTATKTIDLNLTDLFVFRERDQNPSASADDLVFIMDTNPRSLPGQQYFFSTRALYEFKVSRVTNNDATPTGIPDVVLRFQFGPPTANNQQQITLTAIRDGVVSTATGVTTPRAGSPIVNQLSLGTSTLGVFAGLREEPFFFDFEQFVQVRAGARGFGPAVGFRDPSTAVDDFKDFNVNAIAVRVPARFLLSAATQKVKTFDVWETISVPGPDGQFTQVERLARPAVNEGLEIPNDFLNALNSVGPDFEAAALAGQEPAATIAAPIVAEAKANLLAFGNNDARANALLAAFLPDVIRIDTSQPSGYANALNAKGSPITGRLLLDDTIDITLSVLSNGAIPGDNVSYTGTPGNPNQGHDPLSTSFPYLAPAN